MGRFQRVSPYHWPPQAGFFAMDKPAVFLSHSTVDAKPLGVLRELLDRKTGGTLALFLSSDGQSIPLGRNWVHAIQQALETCQLMFVFITPSSQQSSWLFFEAGFAYSKNTRVVPVAMFGLDLKTVAPPLSLLQGFNVSSAAGLNNLIAVINSAFHHKHTDAFTDADYDAIMGMSSSAAAESTGGTLDHVARIELEFTLATHHAIDDVAASLSDAGVDHVRNNDDVEAFGAVFEISRGSPRTVSIGVSVQRWAAIAPAISAVVQRLSVSDAVQILVKLGGGVQVCSGRVNLTARLAGSPVSLDTDYRLRYEGYRFFVEWSAMTGLSIHATAEQIPRVPIHALVRLLFERRVFLPV
jgi:hypothetical protein